MSYANLESCLLDLEKNKQLVRIKQEIDPYLEMAALHLRVHENGGPALLFENIKGCKYRAASNIFGTLERSKYIFKDTLQQVKNLIELKNNPMQAFKNPMANFATGLLASKAFPLQNPFTKPVLFEEISIADLPQIHHWQNDGGAFITLPQVYTEDIEKPNIRNANLGMYRIQLNGNAYETNKEIGLHYQLHRGIGVHQTKANQAGKPLKVSCFVGGPPAHSVAAVMPLPEGISEMTFAGVLANRRFRYVYKNGFCISTDADFVITGTVVGNETKPEGPFGDHLGYYSLQHAFPVMKVEKVYAKKNAIWPFTVVGRPPQEDTSFGQLIHEITGNAIQHEIPGLKEINAVDAAGVHPLLLAVGSERYTPYNQTIQPAELLTIANHILGTGQLSLAKFLFITADNENKISTHNIEAYFTYLLERINLQRDIHFYTNTSIDTLDYSGTNINQGSKIVLAAYGNVCRELCTEVPDFLQHLQSFSSPKIARKGIVALQTSTFTTYQNAQIEMHTLNEQIKNKNMDAVPILIVCDDANFVAANLNNFLWTSFTRCNPAKDIYGINEKKEHKHWGCSTLIIDARTKPHHAPLLEKNSTVEKNIDRFFTKSGELYGV